MQDLLVLPKYPASQLLCLCTHRNACRLCLAGTLACSSGTHAPANQAAYQNLLMSLFALDVDMPKHTAKGFLCPLAAVLVKPALPGLQLWPQACKQLLLPTDFQHAASAAVWQLTRSPNLHQGPSAYTFRACTMEYLHRTWSSLATRSVRRWSRRPIP
jgi:hypothetical protein